MENEKKENLEREKAKALKDLPKKLKELIIDTEDAPIQKKTDEILKDLRYGKR